MKCVNKCKEKVETIIEEKPMCAKCANKYFTGKKSEVQ